MELEEYIKQSYLRPNKQILESLGANDELIEYLRTTPWNTNLNIVNSLSDENKNTQKIFVDATATFEQDPDGDYRYYYAFINYIWDNIPSKITLTFDDETYENIQIFITDGPNIVSGAGVAENGLFTFDFNYTKNLGSGTLRIGTQQTGNTHHVIIYDTSEN